MTVVYILNRSFENNFLLSSGGIMTIVPL